MQNDEGKGCSSCTKPFVPFSEAAAKEAKREQAEALAPEVCIPASVSSKTPPLDRP